MNVQRAEADITEISLAAVIGHVVNIFLSIDIACSSRRLVPILKVLVWELVLGIEHFALMHDPRACLEIMRCLRIILTVDLQDTSVEIEVLFVEDVLLIIICVFFILALVIATCDLIQLVAFVSLQFPVQLLNLLLVKLGDVLELVLFFLFFSVLLVLLLDSEPEVILPRPVASTLLVLPVLLFPSSDSSDFVHLGPVGARDDLAVLM